MTKESHPSADVRMRGFRQRSEVSAALAWIDRHALRLGSEKVPLEEAAARILAADVIEQSAGAYEARIRLPMAGDWRFVVAGTLADGSRITHDTPVPGVRAAATPGGS